MRSPENPSWSTAEDNHNALFTNAEARAARILRVKFDMTIAELMQMYRPCSRNTMSCLLRGITYVDAGGPIATPGPRPRR